MTQRNAAKGEFERRLRSIAASIAPPYRRRARREIESVRKTGVGSPGDLLTLARNAKAPAELRIVACWILGRLTYKRAAPAVLVALRDENPRVRREAAQSLGELGSDRAIPGLVAALGKDDDRAVRMAAASALGSLGDPRAFRPLVSTLRARDEDPRVRGMAAEALAKLRARGTAATLIDVLSDHAAEVRFWAAFGLGQLGAVRALPELERLAAADDARVRGCGTVKQEAREAVNSIRRRHRDRRAARP